MKFTRNSVIERGGRKLKLAGIGRAAYWYGALQVSPSYELARLERAGELPADAILPADFDAVLAVYDDLGDVKLDIEEWTNEYAFKAFGHGGEKPSVTNLGVIRYGDQQVANRLDDFASSTWIAQGERSSLIAAIPLGMAKAQILSQIAELLDTIQPTDRDTSPVIPRYKVTASSRLLVSVRKYLRCLELRKANPAMPLWQIGIKARLSRQYSSLLAKSADGRGTLLERQNLKEMTSRAVSRGHMIAENAARGAFPSYAKCEHALPMDYERLKPERA
ncbi:hypothetical protein [Sphingobium lactosutens]|uniref:Uncharacterized protein n=1 Tax=Sphingobium lactosutens DS20 TaxID=1331060 RepID=T0HLV8_9SPHN|nr:hypothetical protein [Sphingobium lactosutens]EQB13173.1 hypothetical protein RLDS_17790 [Sphingobium lactosutens DS20]